MKQLLTICLLVLFGFSSTGITLQLHFCCGKLKEVNLRLEPVTPDCETDFLMGDVPCCETKDFTSDHDDLFAFKDYPVKAGIDAVTIPSNIFPPVEALAVFHDRGIYSSNAPPAHGQLPLYKLHRVFRI